MFDNADLNRAHTLYELVSIPCLNQHKYLENAKKSAYNQLHKWAVATSLYKQLIEEPIHSNNFQGTNPLNPMQR